MNEPIREFSYGEPNLEYISSWFGLEEDGPIWALNLMKYRARALDAEGNEEGRSGLEADNEYAPIKQIDAVGGRMVLVAPVEKQIRGDGVVWDRIAIVLYPTRMSFVEMSMRDDFQRKHEHKNAGMETTIVVASMPRAGEPLPTDVGSAVGTGDSLLLQVVTDSPVPDLADPVDSTRIASFEVEGNIFGDERRWAEARWDRIGPEAAAVLMSAEPVVDRRCYACVLTPQLDTLAESVMTPVP